MFDFWAYAFMQRAYFAGLMVAILCPTIGIYLVLRRLSMIGEMFAHVSLAGVALGIFTGVYPLATALGLSLGAAVALETLRRTYRVFTDLAIAIIISAGLSLAVVLIGLSRALTVDLHSYLFGSVIAISPQDLRLVAAAGLLVVSFVLLFQKELFYIAFDEEVARSSGVPVDMLNLLFVVATALTISVSMRVVGILLVSSLITIPVAAALQVGRSFRSTALLAYIFSIFSVLCGLFFSYHANLAPGGSIVLTAVTLFVFAAGYRKIFAAGGKLLAHTNLSRRSEEEGVQANVAAAKDY